MHHIGATVLLVDDALVTTMHSLHFTILTKLQAMHGGLTFSGNMFLNIPLLADWHTILAHWEQSVNNALLHSLIKSVSILTTRLFKKLLNMIKSLKVNWSQKLLGPLKFVGSTPMELWQIVWDLVLLSVLMFDAPCHIGRAHAFVMLFEILVFLCQLWGGRVLYPFVPLQILFHRFLFIPYMVLCEITCTCQAHSLSPLTPLLFCPCVHWTPCLVLYPLYHNFKNNITQNWVYHIAYNTNILQTVIQFYLELVVDVSTDVAKVK